MARVIRFKRHRQLSSSLPRTALDNLPRATLEALSSLDRLHVMSRTELIRIALGLAADPKHIRQVFADIMVPKSAATKAVAKAPKPKKPQPQPKASAPNGGKALAPKTQIIADLLTRLGGCTAAEVLKATGWPSVSMPQAAKRAGLELRTKKEGRRKRYYGVKKRI